MGRLAEACQFAVECGADGLHVDIMDAHFVPNLSMGPDIVKAVRESVEVHMSVHLMMTHPHRYLRSFIEAGADTLQIHIECESDVIQSLKDIRSMGVRPGITLNPDTPARAIYEVMDRKLVDEVLFMSVYPGFGGQQFMIEVLDKVREIRARYPYVDISIDGGVDIDNAEKAAEAGANIFIAGTSLFKSDNMQQDIATMRERTSSAFSEPTS